MAKQGEHGISWCHATFNPWWGCTRVSPACGLPMPGHGEDEPHGGCYAEELDQRFPVLGQTHWGHDAPRRFFGDAHWAEPRKWNRGAKISGQRLRVFCASMCDVLEDRPDLDAPRLRLWSLIEETPFLDWLLLTKRPQSYQRMLPKAWRENPKSHVWLGATVESGEYLWRVEYLLGVRAAVHWISAEPLLGSVDFTRFIGGPDTAEDDLEPTDVHCVRCGCLWEESGITAAHECPPGFGPRLQWIVTGSESGPRARPSQLTWFRQVRDACRAAGAAFHMKQITKGGRKLPMDQWPDDLRIQQFPEVSR